MNVAIVDMSDADADQAFVRTLRDTGFAVLRGHPLDQTRLMRMAEEWLTFFRSDSKRDYLAVEMPSGNTTGYVPPEVSETAVGHGIKDLKEFYHITPEAALPPTLESDAQSYLDEAFALGMQLLSWLDEYLGERLAPSLRGCLAQSLSKTDSLLRVLHYPPLAGDEPVGAVRAAAHEDINLLTLLPVSQQTGLQVQTRDQQWIDVPGEYGDLVVNAGDMLQEASARHFPSTPHRVINPPTAASNESRISIPYFLAPQLDVQLSPRCTAGSYLRERLAQLAR